MAVRKNQLSKASKALRLIASFLDPRIYLHGIKMLNYWSYSHVQPLRPLRDCISPQIYCRP